MDMPTVSPSGNIFNYDALKSQIIQFNKDPISKNQCRTDNIIKIKNIDSYNAILEQSFIDVNNILYNKEYLQCVLDTDKYSTDQIKKQVNYTLNKVIKQNNEEYKRLIDILEEYEDKLVELRDIKLKSTELTSKLEEVKQKLLEKEFVLRNKQKEQEISASEDNINLFNSIKNHKDFDSDNIASTLKYYHDLYKYKEFKTFANARNNMDSEIIISAIELNELIDLDCLEYVLLFKTSRDGFNASKFHEKCDNQGPTLIVIQAKNDWVLGGYTDVDWTSNSQYTKTENSFIFSMKQLTKHMCRKDKTDSIYGDSSYGPTFGGGHDLYISSDGNDSQSNFGSSYHLPDNLTYGSDDANKQLGGEYNFGPKKL